MAIFPVSPSVGQEETVLGRTFVYDGYGWVLAVPHKVGEAPIDGNQYARKDGEWKVVAVEDTSKWEDEGETLVRPKDGKKVDASHIEGLEQGGHTFEDSTGNTLPTHSVAKAGAGIEFEDDDVNEKTVVKVSENLTSHIDGANEGKHISSQIVNTAALPNIGLPANSSQEQINAAIPGIVEIRKVSGGFSLTAADGNKYIRFTLSNNLIVTVPNTLEIGKPVTFWQAGAGKLTLVPDSGVTLNGPNTTYSQNTAMQLMKVADNLFDIIGGV